MYVGERHVRIIGRLAGPILQMIGAALGGPLVQVARCPGRISPRHGERGKMIDATSTITVIDACTLPKSERHTTGMPRSKRICTAARGTVAGATGKEVDLLTGASRRTGGMLRG